MSTARYLLSLVLVPTLLAVPAVARTYRDYFRYVFPPPSARFVAADATVILRPLDVYKTTDWGSSVHVTGRLSGIHPGKWIVADDNETIIFQPHRPFEPGEQVSVSMDIGPGPESGYGFGFTVARRAKPLSVAADPDFDDAEWEASGNMPVDTRALPSVGAPPGAFPLPSDFPPIEVTINDNPDDGYLFLANRDQPAPDPSYMLILDNDAFPVFFREMEFRVTDFKKQPNGLLTYFDRLPSLWRTYAMDNTYTVVDEWIPGNGYPSTAADVHDFLILPNGHAVLMIYDEQTVDMSQIVTGGQPFATVIGLVIQELDSSKNVVFQWRSWDHFQITDASSISLLTPRIDYVHGNSMELDLDGNLLISSRSLEEITKIDRQTGDVIWRMGRGSQNEFTLVGATHWFSRQHDARRLANGHITVFNNGNNNSPQESSAIEYMVDEVNKTATQVWEYRHAPPLFAAYTGNAQRLPNGNTLISWGNLGIVTEVRPDGTRAFEMHFVNPGTRTYRTFRFPWSGVAAAPTLWAEKTSSQVTLHFTKFGDNDVDHYNIYQSPTPGATTPVGSSSTGAFTLTNVTGGEVLYCRVTAVDPFSVESPFSNEVQVQIPYVPLPVLITEFAAQAIDGVVLVSWAISADEDFRGYKMLRRADAGPREWISGPELIAPGVARYADERVLPGETYEYTLAVVFADGSELLSRNAAATVQAAALALYQNRPNPFNPTTVISFALPGATSAELTIYDVNGAVVRTLKNGVMGPGPGQVTWDGRDDAGNAVSTGIYFYRLTAGGQNLTRKMVLLK